MSGELSHIELGCPDTDRAQRFYAALLGWRFESTDHGARAKNAGIPLGLHGEAGVSLQAYFRVSDLDAAATQIVELGGRVGESGEKGASGRWLYECHDDQGVPFGLHERPTG